MHSETCLTLNLVKLFSSRLMKNFTLRLNTFRFRGIKEGKSATIERPI